MAGCLFHNIYGVSHTSYLSLAKQQTMTLELICHVGSMTVPPMLDLQRLTALLKFCTIKGIDLSTITHSRVVPNLFDLHYAVEYKIR